MVVGEQCQALSLSVMLSDSWAALCKGSLHFRRVYVGCVLPAKNCMTSGFALVSGEPMQLLDP